MPRALRLVCVLIIVALASAAWSAEKSLPKRFKKMPPTFLLIRHAEDPPEDDPSPHLAAEGVKRANALPELFKATKQRPDPFPTPDVVFAAKSSKQSQRPVETIALLAQNLKIPVNADYDDETDVDRLVADLLANPQFAGKTILICWRHESLPDLAHKLGATDAPDTWKGFDRIWQISYDKAGQASFQNRPQSLMPGDSKK
jgi:hypothetical protein